MDSIAELSDSLENLKLQSIKPSEEKQGTSILLVRGPTGGIPKVASGCVNNHTHGADGGSLPMPMQFAAQDKTGNRRHLEEFEEQPLKYMRPDESQHGCFVLGGQQHFQSSSSNMLGISSVGSGHPVYQQHLPPPGDTQNFPGNQFANVQGTSQPNQGFSPAVSNLNYEKPKPAVGLLGEEITLGSFNLMSSQGLNDSQCDFADNLLDSIEKERAGENEVEKNLPQNTKRQSDVSDYSTESSVGSPSDQRVPSPGSSSIIVPVSSSTENFFDNSPVKRQHGHTSNINIVGIQSNPSFNNASFNRLDYLCPGSDNGVDGLEETLKILQDMETGNIKDLIPVNQQTNATNMSLNDQNNPQMPNITQSSTRIPLSGDQLPMQMFSSSHVLCGTFTSQQTANPQNQSDSLAGCLNSAVHSRSIPLTHGKATVTSTIATSLMASVSSETSQTGFTKPLGLPGSCFPAQQVPRSFLASQKNCFAVDPNNRPLTSYNIPQSVVQPLRPSQKFPQANTYFTPSYGLYQNNCGVSEPLPESVCSQSVCNRQQLPQNGAQACLSQTSVIPTSSISIVPALGSGHVTAPNYTPVSDTQMANLIGNSASAIPPYMLPQSSANYTLVCGTQIAPRPTTVPNIVTANAAYMPTQNAAIMGVLPNTSMKIIVLPPGVSVITSAATVTDTTIVSASKPCTKFPPIAPKPVTTSGMCSASLGSSSSSTHNTKISLEPGNRKSRQAAKQSALVSDAHQQRLCDASRLVANFSSDELQRKTEEGDTHLHLAIYNKQEYIVHALLERICHEELRPLIDHENTKGRTPLYIATFLNQPRIVGMLVKCGADPNTLVEALSKDGTTERKAAIHVAACQGLEYHKTLVELLKAKYINMNINNTCGQTALHCAVLVHGKPLKNGDGKLDSREIVRTLIKSGADPCAQEHNSGRIPLMHAIKQKKVDVVETILKAIEPDRVQTVLKTQDFSGTSCLSMAEFLSGSSGAEVWNKLNDMLQKALAGRLC